MVDGDTRRHGDPSEDETVTMPAGRRASRSGEPPRGGDGADGGSGGDGEDGSARGPSPTTSSCGVSEEKLWSWIDRGAPELADHIARCPECRRLAEEFQSGIRRMAPPPVGAEDDGGPPPPSRIGSYRIVREIDRGGMGIVYLGVHDGDHFRRHVAIKLLKKGMDTDDVLRRFELERQLLGALNHPGIARLFEAGQSEDGRPYFVMEYVEGLALTEYCDRFRLPIADRLRLFRKVCAAVHYAHQNLVVHRDLKPSNILVTREAEPKLLDFGIAKLLNPQLSAVGGPPTAREYIVLTPEYASPEQVRGDPITTASDVYSLGVLLYELLCGHAPYRLKSRVRAEIERVICEEDPERPSTAISRIEEIDAAEPGTKRTTKRTLTPDYIGKVRDARPERLRKRLSGDIDNIVLMAMRKEPARRYTSAEQFGADIGRHLDGLPVLARKDTRWYRTAKFVRRNRWGVAAAALFVLVLLGGILGTESQRRQAEGARDKEKEARAAAESERDRADRSLDYAREFAKVLLVDFHAAVEKLDGSLPVRDLLVTTALKHLEEMAKLHGDDDALKSELALGYDRVGDIYGGTRNPSEGDVKSAMEQYEKAFALRKEVSEDRPNDPEARQDLATSYIKIGDALDKGGHVGDALKSYQEALRLCEMNLEDDPAGYDVRRAVGIALENVGDALLDLGRRGETLPLYERALGIREGLAAERTQDETFQRDLSSIYLRTGGLLLDAGRYEAALARFGKALAIRRRASDADPDSGRARRDVWAALYFVGKALTELERTDEALDALEEQLEIAQSRHEKNPGSARATRDLAAARQIIGEAYAKKGDWADARDHYGQFKDIMEKLVEEDLGNAQLRQMLAEAWLNIGQAEAGLGDAGSAIDAGTRALGIIEALPRGEGSDIGTEIDRAQILLDLGRWLSADGQSRDAKRRLETAGEAYQGLTARDPDRVVLRNRLAEAEAELAKLEGGSEGVSE